MLTRTNDSCTARLHRSDRTSLARYLVILGAVYDSSTRRLPMPRYCRQTHSLLSSCTTCSLFVVFWLRYHRVRLFICRVLPIYHSIVYDGRNLQCIRRSYIHAWLGSLSGAVYLMTQATAPLPQSLLLYLAVYRRFFLLFTPPQGLSFP